MRVGRKGTVLNITRASMACGILIVGFAGVFLHLLHSPNQSETLLFITAEAVLSIALIISHYLHTQHVKHAVEK